MQPFASGATNMVTSVRVFPGRSMVTGRRVGTPIPRRYAQTSSICLAITNSSQPWRNRGCEWQRGLLHDGRNQLHGLGVVIPAITLAETAECGALIKHGEAARANFELFGLGRDVLAGFPSLPSVLGEFFRTHLRFFLKRTRWRGKKI
jgi:hypothetical protein